MVALTPSERARLQDRVAELATQIQKINEQREAIRQQALAVRQQNINPRFKRGQLRGLDRQLGQLTGLFKKLRDERKRTREALQRGVGPRDVASTQELKAQRESREAAEKKAKGTSIQPVKEAESEAQVLRPTPQQPPTKEGLLISPRTGRPILITPGGTVTAAEVFESLKRQPEIKAAAEAGGLPKEPASLLVSVKSAQEPQPLPFSITREGGVFGKAEEFLQEQFEKLEKVPALRRILGGAAVTKTRDIKTGRVTTEVAPSPGIIRPSTVADVGTFFVPGVGTARILNLEASLLRTATTPEGRAILKASPVETAIVGTILTGATLLTAARPARTVLKEIGITVKKTPTDKLITVTKTPPPQTAPPIISKKAAAEIIKTIKKPTTVIVEEKGVQRFLTLIPEKITQPPTAPGILTSTRKLIPSFRFTFEKGARGPLFSVDVTRGLRKLTGKTFETQAEAVTAARKLNRQGFKALVKRNPQTGLFEIFGARRVKPKPLTQLERPIISVTKEGAKEVISGTNKPVSVILKEPGKERILTLLGNKKGTAQIGILRPRPVQDIIKPHPKPQQPTPPRTRSSRVRRPAPLTSRTAIPSATTLALTRPQLSIATKETLTRQQSFLPITEQAKRPLERVTPTLDTVAATTQSTEAVQRQRQAIAAIQLLRARQTTIQEPLIRTTTATQPARPRPAKRTTPKPKPFITKQSKQQIVEDLLIKKKALVKEFLLEIRKKGKFRARAKGTKAELLALGQAEVLRTLAATFRLRPTGRFVEKKPRTITNVRKDLFRQAKGKPPLTFIQKKTKRLLTFAERKKIQAARALSLNQPRRRKPTPAMKRLARRGDARRKSFPNFI